MLTEAQLQKLGDDDELCPICGEEATMAVGEADEATLEYIWGRRPYDPIGANCWQKALENNCYDQHYCGDAANCTRRAGLDQKILDELLYDMVPYNS